MRERKRKSSQRQRRRVATWQISRLRATPAAFIGLIDAPDAASAKERAIKQFANRPEDQKRLIAVRH
jgi:gamma-glutamylcysteine synthetase